VQAELAHALMDIGFTESLTGWDAEIGVRFRHRTDDVYIDVLRPANSNRLRGVVPPRPNKATLEAPGSDFALATATEVELTYVADSPPLSVRVPSVLGALHAKGSAWRRIRPTNAPHKHLQDAAALLAVSTVQELLGAPAQVRKRLLWLREELWDPNSVGWQYVPASPRRDAIQRLATVLDR